MGTTEHQAELNRARVKKFLQKVDQLTIRLPKGTIQVLRDEGYIPSQYVKEALIEKMKKDGLEIEKE